MNRLPTWRLADLRHAGSRGLVAGGARKLGLELVASGFEFEHGPQVVALHDADPFDLGNPLPAFAQQPQRVPNDVLDQVRVVPSPLARDQLADSPPSLRVLFLPLGSIHTRAG